MPSARHPRRADSMAGDGSRSVRCKVMNCGEKRVHETLASGVRIYSSYCQDHTCVAPRNEHTQFCATPRGPGNRYCPFHGKCRAHGCTQQATRLEREPFPYLCPHHRCRYCTRPRLAQFRVCDAHLTCQVRGCPHRPDPSHPGLLCRDHACTIAGRGCPNPAVGAVGTVGHCAQHLPCGVVRGCTRPRARLPDGRQLVHCGEHVPCAHAAQGCRDLALPRAGFCRAHKCSLEGCPREKDGGGGGGAGTRGSSHYCRRHTCSHAGCRQAIAHIDAGDGDGETARFCGVHECGAEGCAAEAGRLGGYCAARHGCAHGSCNALRKGGSHYCAEHRCRAEGCRHEAAQRNGFCRSQHACVEAGCRDPRVGGREHIPLCLGHWRTAIRRRDAEARAAELEERDARERLRERMDRARASPRRGVRDSFLGEDWWR